MLPYVCQCVRASEWVTPLLAGVSTIVSLGVPVALPVCAMGVVCADWDMRVGVAVGL